MAGTNIFVLTPRVYAMLAKRGMDLRCQCGCNALLEISDTVVSKPSEVKRRYFLLEHYNNMEINLNHINGEFTEENHKLIEGKE